MNVQNADTDGKYIVVSLFAGCGGSSLGYKLAGYKEVLAIDFNKNAVETFKLNFPEVPIWQRNITKIKGQEILAFCGIKKGDLDVLDGSPPCQGFSTAGKRKVMDLRNDLVNEYIRLVSEIEPKVFIMENVSGMVKGTMKGLFREYLLRMKALDYDVRVKLLNAKYYNVPQSRQRLIFIGVRKYLNRESVFPKPNGRLITVREAIKDLEDKEYDESNNHVWIELLKSHKVYPHLIKAKMGENLNFGLARRLDYGLPSPTVQTSGVAGPYVGSSWFAHPILNRPISIREAARLQSFPNEFRFMGTLKEMALMVGNSVPPLMMKAIAETIRKEILEKI